MKIKLDVKREHLSLFGGCRAHGHLTLAITSPGYLWKEGVAVNSAFIANGSFCSSVQKIDSDSLSCAL